MSTSAGLIVIWLCIEAALQIITIGRPRKPRTPGEALIGALSFGLLAWYIASVSS